MEMEVVYENPESDILILKPTKKDFFIVQWIGDLTKPTLRKILVMLYKRLEKEEEHQVIFNLKAAENFRIIKLISILPQFIPKFYSSKIIQIAIVSNHKTHSLSHNLWATLGYLAHIKVQYFKNIKQAQDWFEGIESPPEKEKMSPIQNTFPNAIKEEDKKKEVLDVNLGKKNKLRVKFKLRSKEEAEEAQNPIFRWLFKKINK